MRGIMPVMGSYLQLAGLDEWARTRRCSEPPYLPEQRAPSSTVSLAIQLQRETVVKGAAGKTGMNVSRGLRPPESVLWLLRGGCKGGGAAWLPPTKERTFDDGPSSQPLITAWGGLDGDSQPSLLRGRSFSPPFHSAVELCHPPPITPRVGATLQQPSDCVTVGCVK